METLLYNIAANLECEARREEVLQNKGNVALVTLVHAVKKEVYTQIAQEIRQALGRQE